MTYSLNELEGLLRKAASGAGFLPGHAAAIAAAGIWLARRRFPVCEIVKNAIANGIATSSVTQAPGSIQFRSARAAVDGPAAIDLLIAKNLGTEIVLAGLDEPALLLGMAGVAADSHDIGIMISRASKNICVGPVANLTPADLALINAGGVTVTRTAAPPAGAATNLATRYDPTAVSDTGWDHLTELAKSTYVPASDESRLRGAGAGLVDND